MTENSPHPAAPASGHDIVNTRVFSATPEQMFAAVSDPQHLAAWWGPHGFRSRFLDFNFCPGGRWSFVMIGPDGAEYPNENMFLEINPPTRLVLEHPDPGHRFTLTMDFSPEGKNTRLTWRLRFDSAEEAQRLREFIAGANEQNFDRLATHLASFRHSAPDA